MNGPARNTLHPMRKQPESKHAKLLESGRPTVAVFLDWYDPRILKGIARFARQSDWTLIFDYAQVHKWGRMPEGLTGILFICGPDRSAAKFIKSFAGPKVALASADEGLMGQCMRVLKDDAACGKMAADYLLSIGFRNFLTLGKSARTTIRNRIQAFVDRVDISANTVCSKWIGEDVSSRSIHKLLQAALKETPKPVAIFSPSDVISAHVMRCVLDLGLRIPEEVSILSCDNEQLICDYAPVPLSSIRLNLDMLGYEGAKFLDQLMRKKKTPALPPLIPPVGVVVRQSTNTIAVPDARAAQALRYIWANLQHPLSVNDVAAAAESSPSTLNRLFQQHLGRTITDEIARARLEQAKTLLTTTKLTAKEIAKRCGFNTPNYFNNVFRGATSMTPSAFRLAVPGRKQGMGKGSTSSR